MVLKMKKLLAIIVLGFLIFGDYNSVLANNLTCRDDKNNKVINIFYDQDKIEAEGKTFTNVLIFGNGISAEYSRWKSLFLGFGKVLDESWKINLEFSKPKSASIIKLKHKNGKSEQLSESLYLC
mgnify:CR=1 FL=1